MKKHITFGISTALLTVIAATAGYSQEQPVDSERPSPGQWLSQLVGEWETTWKMYMQPDQPPMEATGTDSVRALGSNWIIAEAESSMMGAPFGGIMSLGYHASERTFHGTWIDSFSGMLWVYEGKLNEANDALTLETEGPSLEVPGKTTRYREVMRMMGKDRRHFVSSYEAADGSWVKLVEVEYRRKDGSAAAREDHTASSSKGAMLLHYLEIVSADVKGTCDALTRATGVKFSEPIAELGSARIAQLSSGAQIGVRSPMGEEQPVVRPYVLVNDIEAAVEAAEAAGAVMLMPPTEIPGRGSFAIYSLGQIEHGLWQNH